MADLSMPRNGLRRAADSDAADALVHAGDLSAARDLLAARLRVTPGDTDARMFLFQLLCVEEDWVRAAAQLRILAGQASAVQMLAAAYRPAIQAMAARDDAFAGQSAIPLLAGEDEGASAIIEPARRDEALLTAPDTPGEIDGRGFDFLFDGDQRFGPAIEAIVGGRWGLIPFAAIASIDTEGPVDLRDLVWLPAEIRLRDGRGLAALLPVTYPGTGEAADTALRLARRTEWRDVDGIVHGLGQRVWTTSAGEDVPILEFRRLRFNGAA